MIERERKAECLILCEWLILISCWFYAGEASPSALKTPTTNRPAGHRNAYATMMYMGTPRDYEYYVATRVMLRSLLKLAVDADLVVIASLDVPLHWVRTLEVEDGARVMRLPNLNNPYSKQGNFDWRFKLTMNKLYAWNLMDYDRVIMLDSDNLFLHKTDELFSCGQFCAVFINPCIFHTGLFVLQPSAEIFKDMVHELEIERENPDGADQGFIGSYFPNLLDKPMFYPLSNGTKLDGQYRLPLGYQMDASYYYLKLRWSIPCGANKVITFPGAVWLKPWYWWSWPVLPLGVQWHQQRQQTIGYGAEMPLVFIQVILYLGIIAVTRIAKPSLSKLCHRRDEKSIFLVQTGLKFVAIWFVISAYVIPFFLIPHTVHPLVGWSTYLLGVLSVSCLAANAFVLPLLPVLIPWFEIFGVLLVMAYPWYQDGVIRALAVFGYAFCCSPILWFAVVRIMSSLQLSLERGDGFLPRFAESNSPAGSNKLY